MRSRRNDAGSHFLTFSWPEDCAVGRDADWPHDEHQAPEVSRYRHEPRRALMQTWPNRTCNPLFR